MNLTSLSIKQDLNSDFKRWEHITKVEGIAIHKRRSKSCEECSFKADGLLVNITPDLLMKVYKDVEYQKTWDPTLKEVKQTTRNNSSSYFCKMCLPYIFQNRDFIVTLTCKEVVVESTKFFICEKYGTENVSDQRKRNDFKIFLAATSDNKQGSKIFVQYCFRCDRLPKWFTSWVIKIYLQRTLPNVLAALRRACTNYPNPLLEGGSPFLNINYNI